MAVSVASRAWLQGGSLSGWLRAAGRYLPIAIVVLVWQLVVEFDLVDRAFLPSFSETVRALWEMTRNGEIVVNLLVSLYRALGGLLIGSIIGVAIGLAMATSRRADQFFGPLVATTYSLPKTSLVPLFILWFGIFEASKIILIAVGVFFPVYLGVMGAVMSVDRKIVEVGRAFRLSGIAMVRRILLPAVMPAYVISLRAGMGLGWMFVVAAEFMGASTGLGFLLIDGQQLGKPAQIVAAIVAFAILGKATDWLIVLLSAPFLRWEDRFART